MCLRFLFLWLHLYVRFSCISPFGEMIYLLSTFVINVLHSYEILPVYFNI